MTLRELIEQQNTLPIKIQLRNYEPHEYVEIRYIHKNKAYGHYDESNFDEDVSYDLDLDQVSLYKEPKIKKKIKSFHKFTLSDKLRLSLDEILNRADTAFYNDAELLGLDIPDYYYLHQYKPMRLHEDGTRKYFFEVRS